MNLRVDLILETEQRSASPVTVKAFLRIAYIVVPVLIAALIIIGVADSVSLNSRLKMKDAEWKDASPKKEEAIKLREQLTENMGVLQELESWNKARIDWSLLFLAIHKNYNRNMASTVQFTSVKTSVSVGTVELTGRSKSKESGRLFTLAAEGRSLGATAEKDVTSFKDFFLSDAAFSNQLEASEVTRFDPDIDNKSNRVFRIECKFAPRLFK